MEMTMENLTRKYNLGIKLDSEERFYEGYNRSDMWRKARDSGMKNHYSFYAKEIKRIVKEEFGIKIKASSPYWRRVDVLIEATKEELYKDFDELSSEERQDLYHIIHRHCWNLNGVSEETAKLYYEKIVTNGHVYSCFLKEKYEVLKSFIEKLMDSWNYDHTGANMGDCDYDDADFYGFVSFENTNGLTCEYGTEFGKLYANVQNVETDVELRELLNSANI